MADGTAQRVVVLGAGFAGLRAVRRLARAGVRVLWVDRRNYHCFLPLLYQVAIAGLEPQEIAYPARSILRRLPSAEFRLARVVAGDPAARTLLTATGDRLAYDYLIVATGGVAEYFGIPGAREAALRLYDLEDARLLRNHVLGVLEQAEALDDPAARAALLTFVIVGGGPTGVEMAGALAEFRRHVVPRDYRHVEPHAVRLVLLEAGPELLSPFAPRLRERARRDLLERSVEVRTAATAIRINPVRLECARGAALAPVAPRHAYRLPQPARRPGQLVVELLDLRLRATRHRGRRSRAHRRSRARGRCGPPACGRRIELARARPSRARAPALVHGRGVAGGGFEPPTSRL